MSLVDAFADFVGSVPARDVELPWGRAPVWDVGEGAPVVLLHGLAASRRVFFRLVPPLAGRRRVVVPLLRGEDRPLARCTIDELLDDLGALLARLDLRRATLLGFSLGGAIALAYGGRNDPRVEAIVAQGAFARFPLGAGDRLALALSRLAPPSLGSAYFARRVLRGRETGLIEAKAPGLGALNADWVRQTPFATLRSRIRLIHSTDLSGRIREGRAPVTLAHGRLDPVVPPRLGARLRPLLPEARIVEWEEEGHVVPLTSPELLAALL